MAEEQELQSREYMTVWLQLHHYVINEDRYDCLPNVELILPALGK